MIQNELLLLLVNDIPDQAATYRAAFANHGYKVLHATSGSEALALISHEPPACAVVDLRLPDMTGWDLCRTLRARDDCRDLRIVVLTPDLSRMSAEHSTKVGCNAWLTHPVVAEDVVQTVRHVLNLKTAEPSSSEQALVNLTLCPACGSERVRPTLRVSPIQYFCCRACGFCWRIEALASSSPRTRSSGVPS